MDKLLRLCGVLVLLCMVALLIVPLFYLIIMSVKEYSLIQGLFASPSAGFHNYEKALRQFDLGSAISSTLVISIVGLLAGSVYTYASVIAVGNIKNTTSKTMATLVLVLLTVMPANLAWPTLSFLLPKNLIAEDSFWLRLVLGAGEGIRMAALVSMASFFVDKNVGDEARKYTLVYVSLHLLRFFVSDLDFLFGFNVMNCSGTLLSKLQMGALAQTAAGAVICGFLQLFPALAGCALLIWVYMKEKRSEEKQEAAGLTKEAISVEEPKVVTPYVAVLLTPVVILLVTLIATSGGAWMLNNPMILRGLFYGILIAVVSAGLVSAGSLLLSKATSAMGVLGVLLIAVLCVMADNFVGQFLFLHGMCMERYSFLLSVLHNLTYIPVLSLVFSFILKKSGTFVKDFAILVMGFCISFGWFWSSHTFANIMVQDLSKRPLSLLINEIFRSQQEAPLLLAGGSASVRLSAIPYIGVAILVSVVGFCIVALCMKLAKNKDLL